MSQRKAPALAEPMVASKERLQALKDLMPDAFTEGRLDVEKLRASLGDFVETRTERYTFSWNGRRDAMRILQSPSRATLVPAPGEGVNEDATENLFIEGDNLEVLRLLLKPYFRRVKMIYIDPPYNRGDDLVYQDDYSDSLAAYQRVTGQRDDAGNVLISNMESSGRFHSAWLSMMHPRLFVARQLLRDDGIIFVSIGDREVANLKLIMNEVFGEENALPILVRILGHSQQQGIFKQYHEYVLAYAKTKDALKPFEGGDGTIEAGAMKKISRSNPASDFEFPAGTRCEATDGTELKGTWGDTETVELVEGRFVVEDGKLREPVTLRAGWTQMNQMKSGSSGFRVGHG